MPTSPACPISPDWLSTTVKPGYLVSALAVSPASVSTIKPGVLVSLNTTPPEPAQSKPLSPREKFAEFYGFTLPPPPPVDSESLYIGYMDGGLVKPNPFTSENPSTSGFRPLAEGRARGNGPTCNYCHQKLNNNPSLRAQFPGRPVLLPHPSRASSFEPTYPLPLSNHNELLARFNDQFVRTRRNRMHQLSGKRVPMEDHPWLPPNRGPGSTQREVFDWVTLKQPSFISRL
jgi:hypothetical protein